MLDKILVVFAFISLVAFLGVVIGFVAEPDLIVVTTLMVALAMHDFWISVFRPREHSEPPPPTTVSLESLPTGVSGKPASRNNEPRRSKTARSQK